MTVLLRGYGAQAFSEMIAGHTRRGMQGALTRKRLHGATYGYRVVEAAKGLNRRIDEAEAAVVRRIFEDTAEGKSSLSIAKTLNAEGILQNPIYVGRPQVCRTTRSFHPETGVRKVELTPKETIEQEIPELRIVSDDLWRKVHAMLAEHRAKSRRNPVAARRSKYLLSGLVICGCCGGAYTKWSKASFRCSESRKGACDNHVGISRTCINSRVFDRLRDAFRSPELLDVFERTLDTERRKRAASDPAAELARVTRQLRAAETKRENIFRAIEDGAAYASYRARADAVEVEITDLERQKRELRARSENGPNDVPDAAALFARAIEQMEHVLGDPELVDQANQFLRQIVRLIVLVPDPGAQHGLSIKIETDFGAVLGLSEAPETGPPPTFLMC